MRIAKIPTEIERQKVKDPNDVLVKAGAENLNELIKKATVYATKSTDNEGVDISSIFTESQTNIAEEKKAGGYQQVEHDAIASQVFRKSNSDTDYSYSNTDTKTQADEAEGENYTLELEIPSDEVKHGLNKLHLTDAGNAKAFALLFGNSFRFDWKRKRWLYFNDFRWQVDASCFAMQAIKFVARARLGAAPLIQDDEARKKAAKWALSSESRQRLSGALELAQSEPPIPAITEQFDRDSCLLGCANGVIDLRTGSLRKGRQKDYLTKSTQIDYHPNACCPRWLQFLDEVFLGNEELITFIRKAIGYSLTGDITEQCLFICFGTGWNGKSVFLTTLRSLLGDYARNTPFSTFTERYRETSTNDLAALAGVRIVTSSEVSEGRKLNEARVKAMTGGDPITARFLYGEYFDYVPAYKVWLAVNHKPIIKGTDEGIWRRIRLVPFEASFKANPDPYLEDKLNAELSGILRWALEGCLEWQNERLTIAEKVQNATEEYRQESDVIAQFLAEFTIESENVKVKASKLYKAYEEWCDTNGEEPITGTTFGRRMREKGYDKKRLKTGWHYTGIGLIAEDT